MDGVRGEVLEALRAYVVAYQESARDFATHMGLPSSDGLALGEILYAEQVGRPMSPSVLAQRIAMTSGATNALINRLEGHGHVVRSREHRDRRVVTLRSTPASRAQGDAFFGAAGETLRSSLAAHDDADLLVVRDFLREYAGILPRVAGDGTSPPAPA